jgi:hypothetical protein
MNNNNKIILIINHIISACPILAKQHIKRYDNACAQLRFNICKEMEVKLDNEHWYNRVTKAIETSHEGKVNILWNQKMQTVRTNHKPDIIIRDNRKEQVGQ